MTLLLSLVTVFLFLSTRKQFLQEARELPVWISFGVLGFILLTLMAYLTTTTMNYGFDEVAQTVALGLLFLWMARQPESARIRRSVLRVLVATVLLACLIGVFVYAFGPLTRFVGTFLDVRAPWKSAWPNAWAQLLLLTWPIALLFAAPHRVQGSSRSETLYLIMQRCIPVGVILGCLLLSFSRAAMLTFAGQVILLIMFATQRRSSYRRIASIIVCSLAIGLVLFGLSNYLRARNNTVQSLSEKALFLADEGKSSITERSSFWRQSWILSVRRPLLGWGPGSFRFMQTSLMEGVLATSDHSHNVLLKIASERGWAAALLLAVISIALLLPSFRGLFGYAPLTVESALLLTGVMGVIAHNLVDFNLQFIGIGLPFILLMAMLPHHPSGRLNNKFIQMSVLIFTLGLLVATVHEGIFAVTSTLGRRAELRRNTDIALRWYRWSSLEWYSRDLSLAHARLLSQSPKATDVSSAEKLMQRYTTEINVSDVRGWRLRAEIAQKLGKIDEAEQSLRKALMLGGLTDLNILRQLLDLLARQNASADLAREKEFADQLLRQYYVAILSDSHYIALSSNVEEFLHIAELLSHQFPADEPKYQVMAAGVDREAKIERLRLKALQ